MTSRRLTFVALLTAVMGVAPVSATSYFFSTGNPDGRLASLSQPVALPKLETETADDFILTETTSIRSATITGLITTGAPLSSIDNVEVEIYRVFPNDSLPPSRNVPTRMNSPADVEVEIATRDGRGGTLGFSAAQLNASFAVQNTVVTDINKAPGNVTHGEGSTAEGPSMMSVPIRGQSGFRSELRIHASRSGRNGVPGDAIGRGADSCSTSGGCL